MSTPATQPSSGPGRETARPPAQALGAVTIHSLEATLPKNADLRAVVEREHRVCVVVAARLWDPSQDVGRIQTAVDHARRRSCRSIVVMGLTDSFSLNSMRMRAMLEKLNYHCQIDEVVEPSQELVRALKLEHDLRSRPYGLVNAYLVFEHGVLSERASWRADGKQPDCHHMGHMPSLR